MTKHERGTEDAELVEEPSKLPRFIEKPSEQHTNLRQAALLAPAVLRGDAVMTPGAAPPPKDPVATFLSRYVSANSRTAMLASLRVASALLTGQKDVDPRVVPWPEMRYEHVQALRIKLAEKYAETSTNRHLLAVRGVMRECWRLGLIDREAFARIEEVPAVKQTGRETGRALTTEELDALFAACDDTIVGRRDAAIVALAAGGGLRRAEICDLTIERWDAEQRRLLVLGKGNKWRTTYLSKRFAAIVESWLDARGRLPGPLLTPISKWKKPELASPLSKAGLYKLLMAVGERAKVPDFTPHDLRRTFITTLLDKGGDALTVSKLAGHSSVQTTLSYDKRGERAKKKVAALFDKKDDK